MQSLARNFSLQGTKLHGAVGAGDQKLYRIVKTAVKAGNGEKVKELLASTPKLPKEDAHGNTLLHVAARYGHESIVGMLVRFGIDPNLRDANDMTALEVAARYGHRTVVDVLVHPEMNRELTKDKYQAAYNIAADYQKKAAMKILRAYGATPYARGYKYELHAVIENENMERLKTILEFAEDLNLQELYQGDTPLHVAARYNKPEIVKMLLDNGADPKCVNKKGQRADELAKKKGHNDIVKLFPNRQLYAAAIKNNTKEVDILLTRGIDLDLQDEAGNTAVHMAAQCGSLKIVKILFNDGADITLQNKKGQRADELAKENGHNNIAGFLKGELLHAAAKTGKESIVSELLQDHELDPDLRDARGETALHVAAWYGHDKIIELLLNAEARVTERNGENKTPLEIAKKKVNIVYDTAKKGPYNRIITLLEKKEEQEKLSRFKISW